MHRPSTLVIALSLVACAGGGMERCRVGAECRSGVCRSDGTCEPERDAGRGGDGGTVEGDARVDLDAATERDAQTVESDGGARVCSANGDGIVERAEVPLRAGLHATFRVAQDVSVDTRGATAGDSRIWDLSGALPGDADARRDLRPLAGTWYEAEFPGAGWAARLGESQDLLGVFEITDTALLLRGVVSPDDGFSRTLLTYDPAVVVLRFPLRAGDSWTTESTVSGTALGVAAYYTETYTSSVDASGTLITPFGTFEHVLRVRTTLDRLVGALPTRIRSFAFVSECFGTVATIASQDNETQAEFTNAAEVSRLAP